jgi:hypothetical protein
MIIQQSMKIVHETTLPAESQDFLKHINIRLFSYSFLIVWWQNKIHQNLTLYIEIHIDDPQLFSSHMDLASTEDAG